MLYLSVDSKRCTGCQSCLLYCSFEHESRVQPSLARLKVLGDEFQGFKVQICRQCARLFCAQACPAEAIERDAATGGIRVQAARCDGCGLCAQACPFDAIVMDPVRGLALICDLCGGDPQCAKVCAHGAIELSWHRARVDPAQGKVRRA